MRVSVASIDRPPETEVALRVAFVSFATAFVVAVKVALVLRADTITGVPMIAAPEPLVRLSLTPPEGAAALSFRVPVAMFRPLTVVGDIVRAERLGGMILSSAQMLERRSRTMTTRSGRFGEYDRADPKILNQIL